MSDPIVFITLHKSNYHSGTIMLNVDEISSVVGNGYSQHTVIKMKNGDRFEPYESSTDVQALMMEAKGKAAGE